MAALPGAFSHLCSVLRPSGAPGRRQVARWLRTTAFDPFRFERQRGGLSWGAGGVGLAVAGGRGNEIRLLETARVPLAEATPEGISRALAALRAKLPGYLPPVLLGLDGTFLGYRGLKLPAPRPDDLPAWVVRQAPRLMPPGVRLADLALDFRVIPAGGDGEMVQLVWGLRNRLEAAVARVEAAGFCVAGLYPNGLAQAEQTPGDGATMPGYLVVCTPEEVTAAPLAGGVACCLHEVAWKDGAARDDTAAALADRLCALLTRPFPVVRLAVSPAQAEAPESAPVLPALLEERGVPLSLTTAPGSAPALAQAALRPEQDAFYPLPERTSPNGHREADRRRALRIAWGGGVLVALLWMLVMILGSCYAQEEETLRREMAGKRAGMVRMEALARQEQALAAQVKALQALRAGRSGMAGLLETLGRSVPRGLWLRSLRVARNPAGQRQARLSGFARSDTALIRFLANLRKAPAWRPRGALTTDRLDPDTVRRQAGTRIALTRFTLMIVAREKNPKPPRNR